MNDWDLPSLQATDEKAPIAEQSWFQQWREQQMHWFLDHGFPGRREEDWKYTNVAPIAEQQFSMERIQEPVDIDITSYQIENTYRLVFVNGVYRSDLSDLDCLPQGAIVMSTQLALLEHADLLRPVWKDSNKEHSAFSALNASLLTEGLFLYLPKDIVLEKPIHMLYINVPESEHTLHANAIKPLMNHPRHVILLQEHTCVSVLEDYVGLDKVNYFNNVVTHISAGPNSMIDYYKLQRESSSAYHIAQLQIDQQKNSTVNTYHFAIGSRLARDDLQFDLNAPGASCGLVGFYHIQEGQHIDNHSRIDHISKQCSSRQVYKGILEGKSKGVFNGKVVVHPKAGKSSAHQRNNNLLLSPFAEMNTKPELEIYADDVQCAHGATVGQLDEKVLFYLRSRGIDHSAAQHLLTCAFANEILDGLPNSGFKEHIQQVVVGRLAADHCLGGCLDG